MMSRSFAVFAVAIGLLANSAGAALIAEYTFDNADATDTTGNYDLATVGAGVTYTGGYAVFDGSNANYLQNTTGPGALSAFTVSLWVRSSNISQGTYKGIFSNGPSGAGSWQLDNHSGTYRVISTTPDVTGVTGTPIVDQWQHLVVQTDGTATRFYVDGALANTDADTALTNLNRIRLGINRNSDNAYAMDMDTVQVYNTVENVTTLYNYQRAQFITPAYRWNAATDTPANGTWDAEIGSVDYTFAGTPTAAAVNDPAVPGITAAFAPGVTANSGTLGSSTTFVETQSTSFELWFKPENLTGTEALFEFGGNGTGTALVLNGGNLESVTQVNTTRSSCSAAMDAEAAGAWQQAVLVLTINGASGTSELYLNGELVDFAAMTTTSWAGTDKFGLGEIEGTMAGTWSDVGSFDGSLAKFSIYEEALTADTVRGLYDQVVPEPATMGLLVLGGMAIVRRRRG